jgi:hypothetical protein
LTLEGDADLGATEPAHIDVIGPARRELRSQPLIDSMIMF